MGEKRSKDNNGVTKSIQPGGSIMTKIIQFQDYLLEDEALDLAKNMLRDNQDDLALENQQLLSEVLGLEGNLESQSLIAASLKAQVKELQVENDILLNALENNELEDKILELDFFPKYHDWWINELWESHISYFSLMKWKNDVAKECLERKQEKAWTILFNNWIFIKTLISEKSELAFEYQYIFDSLLKKYVKLESELDVKIVKNNKKEIQSYIESEDLLSLLPQHHVLTPYVKYKKSNKKNI